AKVPESEWELFHGVKQKPYSVWYAIYLISPPPDCVTYSFLNNTFGISICYGRITGQIKSMRGWCGDDARPIVELTDAPMPTDYGPKRRPHLKPIEWRTFGEPTLPAPAERVPQLPDQRPTDAERAEAIEQARAAGLEKYVEIKKTEQAVKPVSTQEALDDEIPF